MQLKLDLQRVEAWHTGTRPVAKYMLHAVTSHVTLQNGYIPFPEKKCVACPTNVCTVTKMDKCSLESRFLPSTPTPNIPSTREGHDELTTTRVPL